MNISYPKLILLFSGKRKSGKDHITDLLFNRLNSDKTVIIKISGPIKSYWAQCNNLDLNDLLSASSFKELHRKQMIKWSEEQRHKDYGIFCRQAVEMFKARLKPLWIVSDVRRKTDVLWFSETYPGKVKTIRINATEETRKNRGWVFVPETDDVASECDLDDIEDWDWKFDNNGDEKMLNDFLDSIVAFIQKSVEC